MYFIAGDVEEIVTGAVGHSSAPLPGTLSALMYPFEISPWSGTFSLINVFGTNFPVNLTVIQETQLSVLWHGIVGLVMIAVIIGHIYIGSVGMEGALDAVGSGEVDINWAKEHHALWVEEVEGRGHQSGV